MEWMFIISAVGYPIAAGSSLIVGFFALFMAQGESKSGERPLWSKFVILSAVNFLFCISGTIQHEVKDPSLLYYVNISNNVWGMLLAPAYVDFVMHYLRRDDRLAATLAWSSCILFDLFLITNPQLFLTRDLSFPEMPYHYFTYTNFFLIFLSYLFGIVTFGHLMLYRHGHRLSNWPRDMRRIYAACLLWAFCGFWDAFLSLVFRVPFAISWFGGVVVVIAFLSSIVRRTQEALRIREQHNIILKDLRDARMIQINLIPEDFPIIDKIKISGMFIPMELVGGDFYEVRKISPNQVSVFVSDVSGHGIASAFITAMIKVSLESLPSEKLHEPTLVLEHLNHSLEAKLAGRFITAVYGILNTETLDFTFCSAGHDPPILRFNSDEGRAEYIQNRGRLIGVFDGLHLEIVSVRLNPGDRLLLVTDGVVEERNRYGEMFGLERLRLLCESPDFVGVSDIFRELADFAGNKSKANDDMAAVLVQVSK